MTALVIFALTYCVVAGRRLPGVRLDRPSAALLGAVAMVWAGVLTRGEALAAVNFDTVLLLLGMMILTEYLTEAGFFRAAAHWALRLARTPRGLLVWVVVLSGVFSALFVNDTICLMMTPLVLESCDDAQLDPVPYLLALATAANIGSVATLTGNPQNMIVGTLSGWSYASFARHMVPIAAGGLALDAALLLWLFRRSVAGPAFESRLAAPAVRPRLLALAAAVSLLVLVGLLCGRSLPGVTMSGAALLILLARVPPGPVLERVNWSLLLFFSGLFIVVEGLNRAGWGEALFHAFAPHLGSGLAARLGAFSVVTVLLSNLVSNVPFVLVAAPWVPRFADPALFWLALAMASTFAGNLTLVGSVANVIVCELSRSRAKLGFRQFLAVGVPATVLTVAWGVAVLWAYARFG